MQGPVGKGQNPLPGGFVWGRKEVSHSPSEDRRWEQRELAAEDPLACDSPQEDGTNRPQHLHLLGA